VCILWPWQAARGDEHLLARLWFADGPKFAMSESRFSIDIGAPPHVAEDHPTTTYKLANDQRKKPDLEAYGRLIAAVRNLKEPMREGELSTALKAVDDSKSYGEQPEDRVLASPDGSYVVLAPKFSRPVIVNARTLDTVRLLDGSDPLDIPFAWSPDSRYLAFAPSEAGGQIFIYDVAQQKRSATLGGPARWISALAWSTDDERLASLELVNRRLHKTPFGELSALSGHPDYRNDVVLRMYDIAGGASAPLQLKLNVTEQMNFDFWIEWQ